MVEVVTNKQSVKKAYKENKPFIKQYVTDELPKVLRVSGHDIVVPGSEYIYHGITHIKGEPVDFCAEYKIPFIELEEEDLEKIFKTEFKRRGQQGIIEKVKEVKALHEIQKKQFPKMFED